MIHWTNLQNVFSCLLMTSTPYALNFKPGAECISAVLPFYHIYGQVVVLLTGLAVGAKIIILSKFDPKCYLESIAKYQVILNYFCVSGELRFFQLNYFLSSSSIVVCLRNSMFHKDLSLSFLFSSSNIKQIFSWFIDFKFFVRSSHVRNLSGFLR